MLCAKYIMDVTATSP